jgi:hypothetical protein
MRVWNAIYSLDKSRGQEGERGRDRAADVGGIVGQSEDQKGSS